MTPCFLHQCSLRDGAFVADCDRIVGTKRSATPQLTMTGDELSLEFGLRDTREARAVVVTLSRIACADGIDVVVDDLLTTFKYRNRAEQRWTMKNVAANATISLYVRLKSSSGGELSDGWRMRVALRAVSNTTNCQLAINDVRFVLPLAAWTRVSVIGESRR